MKISGCFVSWEVWFSFFWGRGGGGGEGRDSHANPYFENNLIREESFNSITKGA